MNGFAPFTKSKSLGDVSGPLSGLDGGDLEAYDRTCGQDSAFRNITYVLFYTLNFVHDKIRTNSLYELGTKWSETNKIQVPKYDYTLPMVFIVHPNTIVRELGVEQPEAHGPEMINVKSTKCLSNNSIIYCTLGQTEPGEVGWEQVMSRKWTHIESEVFGLKKSSRIEAGSVR